MNDITPDRRTRAERPAWLPAGTCADLIAGLDWSGTPLGPLQGWPGSLRTVVGILLCSPSPMVLLWGAEGIMLFNDATGAAIGDSFKQALGRPVLDSFPEQADLNRRVLATCLAGKVLSLRDQELPGGSGQGPGSTWWDIDYLPVPGDDGRPAGALANVTEATARVLAQREIEDKKARLAALADNLPGAVVYQLETSRDLEERHYSYVSASVGPLLGIDADAALADPTAWLRQVHPEDLARLHEAERQAARDLATLELEVRSIRPDGRILQSRIVSRPREAPGGGLVWDGMLIDVTATREAEAEHRRIVSLLEAIGAATPDMVYAKDRDSRLLYANPALASLIGRPPRGAGRRRHG